MPIEGTITPASSPAPISGPGTFTPSTPTAPHGAEPQKPVEAAAPPTADGGKLEAKPQLDADGEPVETKKEDGDEAWRLAALANKEKAARKRAEEAKQAEQGLKALKAEIEAREARLKEMETLQTARMSEYRSDPLKLLRDFGLDYNQVSEFVARGNWTPEQAAAMQLKNAQETAAKAASEVAALRKEQQEREAQLRKELGQREVQSRQQQEAQAVASYKNEIRSLLEAEPEVYELSLRDPDNAVEAVYAYVDEVFEQTGKMPTTKQAADYLENKIFEQLSEVISKSKKFAPKQDKPAPARTLSNRMAPSGSAADTTNRQRETENERRARVIADIEKVMRARRG